MAMIAGDIKSMITINLKSRHDSLTDQYNRIFMVKILLVFSFIMGISWFQESINCMVPASHEISDDDKFISGACWIQGMYVFKELKDRVDKVAYFGIPKDMNNDGMLPDGSLCSTRKRFDEEPNELCKEMEKTFYLQYQWMPFMIAALAILYYLPYIIYRRVNNDLITLRDNIKAKENVEKITKHFFHIDKNRHNVLCARVVLNILTKILYLVANVVAFMGLDSILNYEYTHYGENWVSWTKLNNSMAYDYMGMRDSPKPGNLLLPPFGYCELYEQSKDVKTSRSNRHKFVCELSQHILYQYCLLVLWFCLIFGIIISVLGILMLLVHYLTGAFRLRRKNSPEKKIYDTLSFRQLEYLDFIRKKNILFYGAVLDILHGEYKSRGNGISQA